MPKQPEQPTLIVEPFEERLARLYKSENEDLEGAKYRLKRTYDEVRTLVRYTAELTGIDPDELIATSVMAAWHYKDMKWYQVLDIYRSFHVSRKHLAEKKAEDEQKKQREQNA